MGSAHILIVDDDDINIEMLQAYLELEGYRVSSALSGERALEVLNAEAVDLVMLDVRMSGMGGYETCRQIRANPLTKHIPVLMTTGYNDDQNIHQAIQAGVDDILFKPIKPILMLMRVRLLLRLKQLYDELHA